MKISELVMGYPSAAIVGMCKNAGKTTVLNRLIQELRGKGVSLALTSVGRDGEGADVVTGTEKPPIFIYEGTLAATAEKLLPLSDVSREILGLTDMNTPLGRVIVFRARSDGFVQLAGPSIMEQMMDLRRVFSEYGADMTIIDGALSRKSPASGVLDGALVLSTGASYDRDMGVVVGDTAFAYHVLALPAAGADLLAALNQKGHYVLLGAVGDVRSLGGSEELIRALKAGDVRAVRISGALTDNLIESAIGSGAALDGVSFIVGDSSRVLLKKENYDKLRLRGGEVKVVRHSNVVAVTVNPISTDGWSFDRGEFIAAMSEAVPVPVMDVEAEDDKS